MKIEQIKQQLMPIKDKSEADGDKYLFVYFSKSQNAFDGGWNIDAGDALIILDELIREFGFDREAICSMGVKA